MKIVFFVSGVVPNGDLFYTREYVKHITRALPHFEFEYHHKNNSKTLLDINVKQVSSSIDFDKNVKFIEAGDTLYINTWNGLYSPKRSPEAAFFFRGTNFEQLTNTWDYIFKKINGYFGTNISVNPKSSYVPTLDYSLYKILSADRFVGSNNNLKVLISNGPVTSKQSFQSDMKDIIEKLAENHPNVTFICTHIFGSVYDNILFTSNVICINEWDMAEISYLSKYCDIIVGKNSGPFVWCMTQDNLFNPNKTIISLNTREHDSLAFEMNPLADYTWSNNFKEENIFELINAKITRYRTSRG